MFKPGDPAATPAMASEFLGAMGDWLESHVSAYAGADVRGSIANREERALDLLHGQTPSLVFAPPGFWLGHLRRDGGNSPAVPVAQIPRFDSSVERYVLVTRRKGPSSLQPLYGSTVATPFSPDEAYLRRVVFPSDFRPSVEFQLQPTENLADAFFFMLEEDPEAPAAVLLDHELTEFFRTDDLVWPELQVVWRSEPLPRELVIAVGARWDESSRQALQAALLAMGETPEGRVLLELMSSAGFEPVDRSLLDEAVRRYERAAE